MDTKGRFAGLFMMLPVLIWVFVILYYSVNVPWYDDFDPFPDFLRKWIQHPSFTARFTLLFQPNNEHRMVVGKLITLAYYNITGQLDFTFLHIAGACCTMGTLYLFWLAFKKSKLNPWYFLPVPFLLFQLQYHLVFLWAICSLQHQPVVFFVCLSMFLLSRNRFAWAVLAAICATYAMSNGIFVWAAGAVVIIARSRYKHLAIWCLAAILAVGFYFHGLSAQGNESSVDFLIKNPHISVLGFFAFLGGLFDFFPEKPIVTRSVLPVAAGFLIMIFVAKWLLRQVASWFAATWKRPFTMPAILKTTSLNQNNIESLNAFLLGILIFLLSNALIIGLLRPRFGFFVMIVSNYKMYPALFLIVAYLALLTSCSRQMAQKRIFHYVLGISLVIWVISIASYLPAISERRKYLLANAYNQEFNGFGLGHVPYSKSAMYVDTLMKEMARTGVYTYPSSARALQSAVSNLYKSRAPRQSKWTVAIRDSSIIVDDAQHLMSFRRNDGQYAFVQNQQKLYFFKMNPHRYTGKNWLRQYDKGADVEIPFASLLPGSYHVGVVSLEKNKPAGCILRKITVP